jgi:adenylate cyclase
LQLRLLGGFELRAHDGGDAAPPGRKTRALLTCLALSSGDLWPREKLMALLWSDRSEKQARASLRQALAELRRALGEPSPLRAENDAVSLDPAPMSVDAIAFERLAKNSELKEAAALYRGPLFEGHGVRDGAFDDWLLVERRRLHNLAVDVLSRCLASQTGDAAIETALRLLRLEPEREESHRLLMRVYAEAGRRPLALRQYEVCRETLQRELGVAPDLETEALHREIQEPSAERVDAATPAPASKSRPSIAVLPFTNMSGDPAQDHFGDGLTEDIITRLSRFRDLFVTAGRSSFAYKNRPSRIQDVSRELGVRYVLEGSVRTSADRVRVTAQLIDGGSGGHLWACSYDRQLTDMFAVQDEVTETIVGTLATAYGGRLGKAWQERAEEPAGRGAQALDYFLRGMEAFDRFTREDVRQSRDLFHKALELDPNHSKALAKLAWVHIIEALDELVDDIAGVWESARRFATQAIERDDDEPWGHWALAAWYLYRGRHPDRGIAELMKALELNPNDADVMTDYAFHLSYAGQNAKAIEWAQKALHLNPHAPNWYSMQLGQIYFNARRYESALAAYDDVDSWGTIWIPLYIAASHAALGNAAEARRALDQVLSFDPQATLRRWITDEKTPFRDPASREHLRENLRKAGLPE